jgi:hypothetical protein
MRLERPHLLARPDVPEDDGFVPAAGDEDVALWVEGDAEDVRGVGEEGAEDRALRDEGEAEEVGSVQVRLISNREEV